MADRPIFNVLFGLCLYAWPFVIFGNSSGSSDSEYALVVSSDDKVSIDCLGEVVQGGLGRAVRAHQAL